MLHECSFRLLIDRDDAMSPGSDLLRPEEHLGRTQHENILAAIQSIAQDDLNQLIDEYPGKVDVAPDNRKIGRFQTAVPREMVPPGNHHLPVLACIASRYRGNPRGRDWPSRFAQQCTMQDPLGSARLGWRHHFRARQIRLQELIRDQQMTGRVAVEQMMAAGEPKVARYTHPPLTYPASRHRLFDSRKYILFEEFRPVAPAIPRGCKQS